MGNKPIPYDSEPSLGVLLVLEGGIGQPCIATVILMKVEFARKQLKLFLFIDMRSKKYNLQS